MMNAKKNAVEAFGAQFEPEGTGYVYRQDHKGAPIRVSRAELDRFVSEYERGYGFLFWGFLVMILVVCFGYIAVTFDRPEADPAFAIWSVAILSTILFFGAHTWLWRAPARALTGRIPIGRPRSAAAVRKATLARISYTNLVFAAAAAVLLYYRETDGRDLLTGWNLAWTALLGAALMGVGIQAFRKWRSETNAGDDV